MKSTSPPWVHRSISVSCIVLAWSLVVVLGPALFLMAVLRDGMRKSPWVTTRFLIYFAVFLSCELGGIVGALLVWGVTCGGLFSALALRLNFALQKWWAGSLFWGLVRVFGIKVNQRGQADLAILEQNPSADVLFVAHTGFETVHNLESLMSGSLVGHTLEVEFWRVPFADIPTDEEARYRWFWEPWRRLDAWVQERESRMPMSA